MRSRYVFLVFITLLSLGACYPASTAPTQIIAPVGTTQMVTTAPATISATIIPITGEAFTPTPTRAGNCPRDTPKNTWILVVTNISQGKPEITINGVKSKLEGFITTYYLSLNVDYTVEIGNKTYDYNFAECKIVYLKAK